MHGVRVWLLLIAYSVFVSQLSAQFTFSVTTTGFSDTAVIYLKKYYGRSELIIDSIRGNRQAEFHIYTQQPVNGLYFIEAGPKAKAVLMVNTAEKLSVQIDYKGLTNGTIGIANSPENYAYHQLVTAYLSYDSALYTTLAIKVNEFNAPYIAALQAKSNRLIAVQQQMNLFIARFQQQYKATYSAATLAPLLLLPIMDTAHSDYDYYPAFLFRHFWDNTNFSQPELLNHFLFSEQLKNYFRHWVPKYDYAIKEAIDTLQKKAAANPQVLQYINTYLLRNFLKSNAEDLALYVNRNSPEPCGLNLSEAELKKFETLKSLAEGATVPNITLPNPDNNLVNLLQTAANNKLTIVLFWAAHCGKCRAELPMLQQLYQKYRSRGLEVYAINLDENKFNWRDAMQEFSLDWVNVTDPEPLKDSKLLEQFNIQHTPSLFLIDPRGTIVSKEVYGNALSQKVAQLLPPDKK